MGTENKTDAEKVIDLMYNNDAFSQWLGVKRISESAGNSCLQMVVRSEMLNGFDILHGGISYSLADSALAFSSNSQGVKCVSIETSISHLVSVKEGDILTTETEELYKGNKTALYQIKIHNQDKICVAIFKGTVYRTSKKWSEHKSE